jgi:hypothetical protein
MDKTKTYIGDGVYVDHDGARLVVTTENGNEVTNKIYLEYCVMDELIRFYKRNVLKQVG